MDIPALLDALGSTPSASARATGLARSTIQRVRDGKSSPTMETLRELALAAGYDIDLTLVPASDPAAAVAARVILDPATPRIEDLEGWEMVDSNEVAAIAQWVSRLERQAPDDRRRLLELAGRSSAPQHRKGARFFAPRPGISQEQLVEVADGAIGRAGGALSGVAAAGVYLGHAPDPGPIVVWSIETDAVADRLAATLRETGEYQPAGVLLAPTMRPYLVDMTMPPAWRHRIVSPIQAAIDFYGLGYTELADEITEGW
ncbi:helix-turn-helix domain-containing protein [Microbacterium sp. 22215]|uniref:helix-turn-helix domain-containing protein n=1 Tax=Microbacterium sp. 22215 TaxID=3453893 RepID=UPI003F859AC5